MNNNCIFCKIIGNEISSVSLYEDDDFKVIMDIAPAVKGHAVLIPKKHIANLFEMDEETASKIFVVVSKVAKAMKEELQCDGLNILQNNGEAAGQTVFHFHIHLIPRYYNDSVQITWARNSYAAGEAETIAEAISKRIP
ncbi:MAG: HIT family protein [Anaerocolumna sp.]